MNISRRALKYHNDYYKSKRLHNIAKRWGWETHQSRFVKGKLHCSCPMCATKTNRRRKTIEGGWSISDGRKPQFYEE